MKIQAVRSSAATLAPRWGWSSFRRWGGGNAIMQTGDFIYLTGQARLRRVIVLFSIVST